MSTRLELAAAVRPVLCALPPPTLIGRRRRHRLIIAAHCGSPTAVRGELVGWHALSHQRRRRSTIDCQRRH